MKKITRHLSQYTSGFALPTILIASVVMTAVLLSAVQASVSIQSALNNQYINKIGQEAAESGIAYASQCYVKVSDVATGTQWPYAGSLTPKTSCLGVSDSSYSNYVMSETMTSYGKVRTRFVVDPVVVDAASGSYTIKSKGIVESLRTTSGAVAKRYEFEVFQKGSSAVYGLQSGNTTTCAVQEGQLYCWGLNTRGQVGDGTQVNRTSPYLVKGALAGKVVLAVATGVGHTCAIADGDLSDKQNDLYCWGDNSYGQFGNGTTSATPRLTPQFIFNSGSRYFTALAARDHTCIIAPITATPTTSHEFCWGRNHAGQAGESAANVAPDPKPTGLGLGIRIYSNDAFLTSVKKIANTSGEFSCNINGTNVWCWGSTANGQGGYGLTAGSRYKATAVGSHMSPNPLANATALTTNASIACAISSGLLYCWGNNTNDGTGVGYRFYPSAALNISSPTLTHGPNSNPEAPYKRGKLVDVTRTDFSGCVLVDPNAPAADDPGSVWCWGYNINGELGQGEVSGPAYNNATGMVTNFAGTKFSNNILSPFAMVRVNGALAGKKVVRLAGGNAHFCASTEDKRTYCWGRNIYGELGDGTTTLRASPVEVALPQSVTY